MSLVRIATVEAEHAGELVESLAGAGIEARVADVVPMTQVEFVRNANRPMADLFVEETRGTAARALLDRMALEAEAAATEAAAREPDAAPATDGVARHGPRDAAGVHEPRGPLGVAVLLGVVGLAIASAALFGLDGALRAGSDRSPTLFTAVALALFAGLFLALRRRN